MVVQEFLDLFMKEVEINGDLRRYYRLLNNKNRLLWRKAYLEQRLDYVNRQVGAAPGKIWDVGCGYATTAIFLTLNGYQVLGTTLEFYYDKIGRRLDYWSKFGNINNFRVEYANLFDMPDMPQQFDVVVAQDALHHLEPVQKAVNILRASLKDGGRLVVTEENGHHAFIILRNFSQRGFNRVTEYYDERLQKTILFGNENARGLSAWRRILEKSGLIIAESDLEYIRIIPPFCYTGENYRRLNEWEKSAGKKWPFLREILSFGINFTAFKTTR
jgi:SAM-dependent methyltransferase